MLAVAIWISIGVVLGTVGTVVCLVAIAAADERATRAAEAQHLQRSSEARLMQITQDAVRDMLNVTRGLR